jgi:prepilin-type N-terminal cleavage/methylation domain-containing protein
MRCARSRGVTLVELLVVLALLGLVLGMSGLAFASLRERPESDELRELRRARAEAIRSGAPVRAASVLFLPDGRAVGPGVDPLTGARIAP